MMITSTGPELKKRVHEQWLVQHHEWVWAYWMTRCFCVLGMNCDKKLLFVYCAVSKVESRYGVFINR